MGRAAIAGGLCALFASTTFASPFGDNWNGESVFTGPTHPHATALYANPAALGLISDDHNFFLGTRLLLDQFWIDRKIDDPATGQRDGPSVSPRVLAPGGMFAYYMRSGSARVGLGLSTPTTERFIDGVDALRYHTRGGYHYQRAASVAVALRVTGSFFVGTTVSFVGTSLRMRFSRDSVLTGDDPRAALEELCGSTRCGIENPLAEERYDIQADAGMGLLEQIAGRNVALNAGLMFKPGSDWWIGLGVALPPPALSSRVELTGTTRRTVSSRDGGEDLRGDALVIYRLPRMVQLGVRGPIGGGWELVTGVRWQGLGRVDVVDIDSFGVGLEDTQTPEWLSRYRGLKDVVRLELGLEQEEGRALRAGGRLQFDTAGVADEAIAPSQVEMARIAVEGGGEVRLGSNWVVAANYLIGYHLPAHVTDSVYDPSDRLACVESQHALDACQGDRFGRSIPTAAGAYRRLHHAFTLALRYSSN